VFFVAVVVTPGGRAIESGPIKKPYPKIRLKYFSVEVSFTELLLVDSTSARVL
jgi:hypothetical protein